MTRFALVAAVLLAASAARADEPAGPLINEIEINPPGTDGEFEYIELRGPPGLTLSAATYVVSIDGDGQESGKVDAVFDVSNQTFGCTGIIVIHSGTGGHPMPPEATSVTSDLFTGTGLLENGSATFALITTATAPTVGQDLDANDDGNIDDNGILFLDSMAWTDADTDHAYGPAVFDVLAFNPGAMTRFADNFDAQTPGAWFGGLMQSTASGGTPDSLMFTDVMTDLTANFPAGAVLTPGARNFGDLSTGNCTVTADAGPQPDAMVTPGDDDDDVVPPKDDGGCGCRVGSPSQGVAGGVVLLLGLVGVVLGRRRRR